MAAVLRDKRYAKGEEAQKSWRTARRVASGVGGGWSCFDVRNRLQRRPKCGLTCALPLPNGLGPSSKVCFAYLAITHDARLLHSRSLSQQRALMLHPASLNMRPPRTELHARGAVHHVEPSMSLLLWSPRFTTMLCGLNTLSLGAAYMTNVAVMTVGAKSAKPDNNPR